MSEIKLNDILQLQDTKHVKIRLNLTNNSWDGISHYHQNPDLLLQGNFSNSAKKKFFKTDDIVIGLVQIECWDWLLIDISRITKDYNRLLNRSETSINYYYDREVLTEYQKYFGRLVLSFHKNGAYVTLGGNRLDDFIVKEILAHSFTNDKFPGYDKVNVSWKDLSRLLENKEWKSVLENQKGIYLLSDTLTGKKYVGAAYGEARLLGRWRDYIKNGHGGNKKLKPFLFDYIKENFRFTILEIFKNSTNDDHVIERERWWMNVLQTRREFGYNE
ncbi:hypothetical protein GCM10027566_06260 [Arachidicoccus ginsenosidivorans]